MVANIFNDTMTLYAFNIIFFVSHDHFPVILYLKLLDISDLIVADIDTQSILSMVYKYLKILWTSGFVCG